MVYKGLGDTKAAIADYDKVIAIYPEFADAYFSRGFAKKMLGDFGGAIRDYDRAILLNPNDPSQFNNRGILRVLADDFAGAARDFRAAISLQPEYAIVYHNFGMSLIMNHSRSEGCDYLQTSIDQGFESGRDQHKYFCTH
jgi:Flp pilus assembly protein TadD